MIDLATLKALNWERTARAVESKRVKHAGLLEEYSGYNAQKQGRVPADVLYEASCYTREDLLKRRALDAEDAAHKLSGRCAK